MNGYVIGSESTTRANDFFLFCGENELTGGSGTGGRWIAGGGLFVLASILCFCCMIDRVFLFWYVLSFIVFCSDVSRQ